jgi:hypothetical protein
MTDGYEDGPTFIIQCINDGYEIPFYKTPERASFPNNRSAMLHADFVTKSIHELLSTG